MPSLTITIAAEAEVTEARRSRNAARPLSVQLRDIEKKLAAKQTQLVKSATRITDLERQLQTERGAREKTLAEETELSQEAKRLRSSVASGLPMEENHVASLEAILQQLAEVSSPESQPLLAQATQALGAVCAANAAAQSQAEEVGPDLDVEEEDVEDLDAFLGVVLGGPDSDGVSDEGRQRHRERLHGIISGAVLRAGKRARTAPYGTPGLALQLG